jgi:hypothetical protein
MIRVNPYIVKLLNSCLLYVCGKICVSLAIHIHSQALEFSLLYICRNLCVYMYYTHVR